MTTRTEDMSVGLECHHCGYDLRAHPQDGRCPECGASVAESRRLAAIPRRPAWRDSDPRWRRRILAGVWILVLMPLMDVLQKLEWDSGVRVPNVFRLPGTVRTLDETLLSSFGVYQTLAFCVGVVLLFSRERGRRHNRLDWTRRWGVLCSYVTLLLSAVSVLFIIMLVLAGIAALFLAMPLKYQPGVTRFFVEISTRYLRYGPYPAPLSDTVLVASSSIAMLLACVPLFEALRSCGPRLLARVLLTPLAFFALMHLGQAVQHGFQTSSPLSMDVLPYRVYFWPALLSENRGVWPDRLNVAGSARTAIFVEVVKWCAILCVAVWLTVARVMAWRQPRRTGDA